jgi:hypothetical protein
MAALAATQIEGDGHSPIATQFSDFASRIRGESLLQNRTYLCERQDCDYRTQLLLFPGIPNGAKQNQRLEADYESGGQEFESVRARHLVLICEHPD